MNKLLVFLLMTSLWSCSLFDSEEKKEDTADSDEIVQFEEDADFIIEEEGEDLAFSEDEFMQEDASGAQEPEINMDEDFENQSFSSTELTNEMGEYSVESGDTLMWIAFKLYGDYAKWRRIAELNPEVRQNGLSEGQSLSYYLPAQPFEWNPEGEPHLIQNGETLGSISDDKYGTVSRWRDLYENNQPMINDPNLIFAGFTLYYVPDERNVASDF